VFRFVAVSCHIDILFPHHYSKFLFVGDDRVNIRVFAVKISNVIARSNKTAFLCFFPNEVLSLDIPMLEHVETLFKSSVSQSSSEF
jgi:hypothetical protein